MLEEYAVEQNPSNPAVSILERMDVLKLIMNHGSKDKRWIAGLIFGIPFNEFAEQAAHMAGWRAPVHNFAKTVSYHYFNSPCPEFACKWLGIFKYYAMQA